MKKDNFSHLPTWLEEGVVVVMVMAVAEAEVMAATVVIARTMAIMVQITLPSKGAVTPRLYVRSTRREDMKHQNVGTDMMRMRSSSKITRQQGRLPLVMATT